MPSGEAEVFGLTRAELAPTFYRTGGEHVNHYTTFGMTRPKIICQLTVHTHIISDVVYDYKAIFS